ncbi:hypothetical protein MRB53_016821 [Persea americana]|uniref:Uncharacterized protein n=1 Tax=Persea americana TaxID=3435 RepID=A0ACC2M4M6_PERAE|nr:hypothetical protein MRB53_016821 [Persea americana]
MGVEGAEVVEEDVEWRRCGTGDEVGEVEDADAPARPPSSAVALQLFQKEMKKTREIEIDREMPSDSKKNPLQRRRSDDCEIEEMGDEGLPLEPGTSLGDEGSKGNYTLSIPER